MLYKRLIEDNPPDRLILYYRSKSFSYKELYYYSLAIGQEWIDKGIKPGDRIIVECADKSEAVIAMLACLAYGMIFIPIEPDDDNKEYIIKNSGASLVCLGNFHYGAVTEKRSIVPRDNVGYIIYTSGSTSKPKGVAAPLCAIDFCITAINKRLDNNENDIILSRLPLSFDYGLYQVFFALCFGAKLILIDNDVSLLQIPKLSVQMNITAMPVVPTMLSALLNARLLKQDYFPNLRYICSTGETLEVELISKVHNALPKTNIIPMYGLTECKRVSVMPPDRWDKIMAGSCGLPLDGVEVRINDGNGTEGELTVYGPNIMNGYWNYPESLDNPFCINDKGQRYLRTGDYISIDSDGFLYFKYRLKNILKVGGYAVSAAEIEERLKRIKGVIDAYIIGIPDEMFGESICACVYSVCEDIKQVIKEFSNSMPQHKKIQKLVLFNAPFPTNKNGKVDVRALRERVEDGYVL